MKYDYRSIGLRVGLEVHQQLDTKSKLFCNCPTILEEEIEASVKRKLRPTKSELGEIDPAAIMEFKHNRTYIYQITKNSTCLVELDEEPPHSINQEAVEIALTVAMLLNSNILDEIHVMRKEVIDGSNTTGFQRTAVVALGGYLEDENEKVGIETITLEEDASRKIEEGRDYVVYRLDRQGIPLIEIATTSYINDPEKAKRIAYKIGLILRSTGKVKRGIGTIRQDINISIARGAKTEIKGIQELGLIPKVIEYEIERQLKLLELKDKLNERNVPKPEINLIDITELFKDTKSNLIRRSIEKGEKIYLQKLYKMKGLLGFQIQPNRRFASELADYVINWTTLQGIIHSDELPNYGITQEEVKKVYDYAGLDYENDAFIIVLGKEEECREAMNIVIERIRYAFIGVPEETRNAQPDGTTRYSRPRPGSARMYPETDIPPFVVKKELLEKIKNNLPEKIEDRIKYLKSKYEISQQLAQELVDSQTEDLFEKLCSLQIKPTIVATTLTETMKYLKRMGINIEAINENKFFKIFSLLKEEKIAKESLEELITYLAKNPSSSVDEAVEKLNLMILSRAEVEKIIDNIISENINVIKERKEKAVDLTMKILMSKFRGKVNASEAYNMIKEKLKNLGIV
jgi:glutamyl-tRNA(Gln) amidotransferase subunit E